MSNTPATPARLTAPEVQRRIGIGPRRLYDLIAEGRLPAPDLRVYGRRLWNRSTIEAWERQHA